MARDPSPLHTPALLAMGCVLPSVVAMLLMTQKASTRSPGGLLCLWLAISAGLVGVAIGIPWHEHSRRVHELDAGDCWIVEGPITAFRPEEKKRSERFTVGGVTFTYMSSSLAGGGLHSTGGAAGPLHVGKYVRVTYNRDRIILRLELARP